MMVYGDMYMFWSHKYVRRSARAALEDFKSANPGHELRYGPLHNAPRAYTMRRVP